MKIELEIIPYSDRKFTWNDIINMIGNLSDLISHKSISPHTANIEIYDIGEKTNVSIETNVSIDHFYQLSFNDEVFELDVQKNSTSQTDEYDFISDLGRNLNETQKQEISHEWKKMGFSYSVYGHLNHENKVTSLFLLLTSAIAKMCEGLIIVEDNNTFAIQTGIYSLEEFSYESFSIKLV